MRLSTSGVTATSRQRETRLILNPETRYKPGMRVRNAAWGEGLVLESRVDADGEETVDIHFESVGFKRVLASLANLEILS